MYFESEVTGEAFQIPALALEITETTISTNTLPAILKSVRKITVEEVNLSNYKEAKKQMANFNRLDKTIKEAVKKKIEDPIEALNRIKEVQKEISKIIEEKYNFLKTGFDVVYGSKVKEICFGLMKLEIEALYIENSIEEEYQIIKEEDIKKLCITSRVGFKMLPDDPLFNFEWGYLTNEAKSKLKSLIQNCLQFKQQRASRLLLLENSNLKAGLSLLHWVNPEDITHFIDDVEPDFSRKLNALVQKKLTAQNLIKAEAERKLTEQKEALEKEMKANEEKIRKEEADKARLAAEAEKQKTDDEKAKLEKAKADAEALVQVLVKEVEKPKFYTSKVEVKEEVVIPEPKIEYEVHCVKVHDISESEIGEVRAFYEKQGFVKVKFNKKQNF